MNRLIISGQSVKKCEFKEKGLCSRKPTCKRSFDIPGPKRTGWNGNEKKVNGNRIFDFDRAYLSMVIKEELEGKVGVVLTEFPDYDLEDYDE